MSQKSPELLHSSGKDADARTMQTLSLNSLDDVMRTLSAYTVASDGTAYLSGPILDDQISLLKERITKITDFTLEALSYGKKVPIHVILRLLQHSPEPLFPSVDHLRIVKPDAEAMQYWGLISPLSLKSLTLDDINQKGCSDPLSYLLDTLQSSDQCRLRTLSIGPGQITVALQSRCFSFSSIRELNCYKIEGSYDEDIDKAIMGLPQLEALRLHLEESDDGAFQEIPTGGVAFVQLKNLYLSANLNFITSFMPRISSTEVTTISLQLKQGAETETGVDQRKVVKTQKNKKSIKTMTGTRRYTTSEEEAIFSQIVDTISSTFAKSLTHLYLSRNASRHWGCTNDNIFSLDLAKEAIDHLFTSMVHVEIDGWDVKDITETIANAPPTDNAILEFLHLPLNVTESTYTVTDLSRLLKMFPKLRSIRAKIVDPSGLPLSEDMGFNIQPHNNIRTLIVADWPTTYPGNSLLCPEDEEYYPLRVAQYLDYVFPNLETIDCNPGNWILVGKLVKMCQKSRSYHLGGKSKENRHVSSDIVLSSCVCNVYDYKN